MHSVLTAPLAILVKLEAVGVVLLVLLGRVVAALALSAGQGDQRTLLLPITSSKLSHTHEFEQ